MVTTMRHGVEQVGGWSWRWVLAGALALGIGSSVRATTYVWDGGGADNNWSSPANWNPDGAPVSADNAWIQFTGGTRLAPSQNIATPFVLNRLDFLGGSTWTTAFSISGNPLRFVNNGATGPRVHLNRNATCVVAHAIEIPSGVTLIMDISTFGVNFTGAITGEGAIEKLNTSGGIELNNSANSFSGGLTVRAQDDNWRKVNIRASGAMGTGPVNLHGGTLGTRFVDPGGLCFFGTTTHANPITLHQTSPVFAGMPNGGAEVVTLNGAVNLQGHTLLLRGGGSGTIGGAISGSGSTSLIKLDRGTWTLSGANTFTGAIAISNGVFRLGAANALEPLVAIAVSSATGWNSIATATFDLNGFNQTVSRLSGVPALPTLTNIVTSASPATLTVNQADNTLFVGRFVGAASLIKSGAGTLTLSNVTSTTSGSITINNGRLALAAGAGLSGSAHVTVAGGVLDLGATNALADTATLNIAAGARVALNATATETVDRLFLGGVQQARGYYGTSASGAMYVNDTFFEGAGILYVRANPPIVPVGATWNAAGGADRRLSTPANWIGNALPAFDGATHATFATGGATALVDRAASFHALTFNRDGSFALAADGGVITNGAGGIWAQSPTTTARRYTIAESLVLSDNQTWNVTNNVSGLTELWITGRVSDNSVLPSDIIKVGSGRLSLTGANTFDGSVTCAQGDLHVWHSLALGSTNGHTAILGRNGVRLVLHTGLHLNEPLTLDGELNNAGTLIVESGSNTISGPVTCVSQIRITVNNASTVIFEGGIQSDNVGLFVLNAHGGSTIVFRRRPLALGTRVFYHDAPGTIVLAVAGNVWSDTLCAGGAIRCDVPNALPPAASLRMGIGYMPNGTLDLNGNDQTTSRLYLGTTNPGTRAITSAASATLTVNQTTNTDVDVRFGGAVNLRKEGAGNLTLTSNATTTSGGFTINAGTLTVSATGSLGPNSTNIVVGAAGTLAIQNSAAIADQAEVRVVGGGRIHLEAGVNETVGWLLFGEKMQRVGSYGSSASGATNRDDTRFSGTGILTVLRDNAGTLIRVQ